MKQIFSLLLLLICASGFSQTLPLSRSVDWTLAGLRDTTTSGFIEIDMQAKGARGDGTTPNDSIIDSVFASITGAGAILNFPAGNFLFNSTIDVPSNIVIKGEGADVTIFNMNLGGTGHSIRVRGQAVNADTTSLIGLGAKDSDFINVADPASFSAGDWIQIVQDDSNLVTSTWAIHTVGQVVKIKSIANDKVVLESPLRMDFNTNRTPYIVKIVPAKNVGIECLKIHRIDDTAPEHTSAVYFSYAVNCWIRGIESVNCTFSHVQANYSSNLYFSKSYFHHAFDYGGGGRAYGVMLQSTSNECLVENNIFERLRHSMILQSGANGNVFSYNYSFDAYWDSAPNDASGDMVLHGNYPYANLFEQNICRNIVIDDSHGPNGPDNTFFRNRAKGFGIFFSATNSPNQIFVGNEIPNTTSPYSSVNYRIQGTGHFLHGNNNKGTITPTGTSALADSSYAYTTQPYFILTEQWAGIGTPSVMGERSIPAYERYHTGRIFSHACEDDLAPSSAPTGVDLSFGSNPKVLLSPNPVQSELTIEGSHYIQDVTAINPMGQVILYQENIGFYNRISTDDWKSGVYFIRLHFSNNQSITEMVVKTN